MSISSFGPYRYSQTELELRETYAIRIRESKLTTPITSVLQIYSFLGIMIVYVFSYGVARFLHTSLTTQAVTGYLSYIFGGITLLLIGKRTQNINIKKSYERLNNFENVLTVDESGYTFSNYGQTLIVNWKFIAFVYETKSLIVFATELNGALTIPKRIFANSADCIDCLNFAKAKISENEPSAWDGVATQTRSINGRRIVFPLCIAVTVAATVLFLTFR